MLAGLLGGAISAATSLFAGNQQRKAEEKARAENIAQQREFAQSGIQWKAEDARKAGIHPLYAMGASTNSFSPVSIGDTGTGAMAQAGQDIGRAIQATRSPPEKVDAVSRTMQQLSLTRMGLENELLASQIRKVNQPGMSAGIPRVNSDDDYLVPGQGDSYPPIMHSARHPQFTSHLKAFGKNVIPSSGMSDAQSYEDRYGEMSDFVAGPAIAISDWYANVYPHLKQQLYNKLRR